MPQIFYKWHSENIRSVEGRRIADSNDISLDTEMKNITGSTSEASCFFTSEMKLLHAFLAIPSLQERRNGLKNILKGVQRIVRGLLQG